jgi:excisionase family DNA binding protein
MIRPHQPTPTQSDRVAASTFVRDDGRLLYTPAEAAQRLQVRESWLRKKAAARQVPCTFLGRHLRFSPADLTAIVAAAAQPAGTRRRTRRTHRPDRSRRPDSTDRPDRSSQAPAGGGVGDLPTAAPRRVHASRPDDHTSDGSTAWPG